MHSLFGSVYIQRFVYTKKMEYPVIIGAGGVLIGGACGYLCAARRFASSSSSSSSPKKQHTTPARLIGKTSLWSESKDSYVPRVKLDASKATRSIVCGDAIAWMDGLDALQGSVLTGLPDIQEMLDLGDDGYSEWFVDAIAKIMLKLPEGQLACFHNTDTRANREDTLSKVQLIFRGVERSGVKASLLWHKIALAVPCGVAKIGRPGYTHMLCFVKGDAVEKTVKYHNFPDVVDRGQLMWSRAMGVIAVMKSVEFIKWYVGDDVVIVDPFCGHGTIAAVANSLGCNSVGVDLSPNCCKKAERANTDELVRDRNALIASIGSEEVFEGE